MTRRAFGSKVLALLSLAAVLPLLPAQPAADMPKPLDCTGKDGLTAAAVKQAQAAWAKYLGRQVEEEDEIAPGVKMKFMLVPPGKFLMGSPANEKERHSDELLHEVEITRPFYLGKYEVTQGQYEAVRGANPSSSKGADLPVETVRWEEARDFAEALSKKLGKGLLFRLPTEAEWEFSCRGGRSNSLPFGIGDGRSLSSSEANCNGNSPYGEAAKGPWLKRTCRVGSYPANALGFHDLHGNVWEWCLDHYGPYPSDRVTDPQGAKEGKGWVFRGGGWNLGANYCRAANRQHFDPPKANRYCGFRLVRVPSLPGK